MSTDLDFPFAPRGVPDFWRIEADEAERFAFHADRVAVHHVNVAR